MSGHCLDTLGTISVTLRLGSSLFQHDMQVLREVNQGVLLGWDFLHQHGAVLDIGRGLCCLHEQSLPLLKATQLVPTSCVAQITVSTTIPPNSEIHCSAKLISPGINSGFPDSYSGLLEPFPLQVDGIAVARTLSIAENRLTVVRLMNPINSPVVLQPGMQLGQFSSISEDDIIPEIAPVCNVSTSMSQTESLPFDVQCGDLTGPQRSELNSLHWVYSDVFSKSPDDFGRTDIVTHKINTNDATPIRKRAYCTLPQMQDVIQSSIDTKLENKIVKVSHSLVRTKDGKWRFCVDYRGLSSVTIKDARPLPRTDDTLDALRGSSVFSTMDQAAHCTNFCNRVLQSQQGRRPKCKEKETESKGLVLRFLLVLTTGFKQ